MVNNQKMFPCEICGCVEEQVHLIQYGLDRKKEWQVCNLCHEMIETRGLFAFVEIDESRSGKPAYGEDGRIGSIMNNEVVRTGIVIFLPDSVARQMYPNMMTDAPFAFANEYVIKLVVEAATGMSEGLTDGF